MSDEPKTVHVSPTGENWEVESDSGTLAQAETKEEAIQAARAAALDMQADEIAVHTSDGRIEARLPVRVQLGAGEAHLTAPAEVQEPQL